MPRIMLLLVAGLVLMALTTPIVMAHHQRVELLQLAWCSNSGRAMPETSLLALHCPACPIHLAGWGLIAASTVYEPIRRLRAAMRSTN